MMQNILLITVDSLRIDHVGTYGYERPITPTIDKLAKNGTKFTNAVATSSHTKDAFPGIFSSVYPSIQGSHHVNSDYKTLAKALSDAGYETVGYHSTPMMASYGYDSGFDEFVDLVEEPMGSGAIHTFLSLIPSRILDPLHRILMGNLLSNNTDAVSSRAPAGEITSAVLDYLSRSEEPFFIFAHYMDTHTPYSPPERYIEQYTDGLSEQRVQFLNNKLLQNKDSIHGDPDSLSERELKQVRNLYDASIRYVDDCIGKILSALSDNDILDETIVILTADHGEEFRDHGGFFHGQKLYEELVKVPLIYSGPGISQQSTDTQVSHIGLMPTILDHLGIELPDSAIGTSYASEFSGDTSGHEFALSETTMKRLGQDVGRVISCRYQSQMKLIYNEQTPEWSGSQWELYDLREDPAETSNIYNERNGEIIDDMRKKINDVLSGNIEPDESEEVVKDRLKDLGYID